MRSVMALSPIGPWAENRPRECGCEARTDARWGRVDAEWFTPVRAALDWIGEAPIRTPGNDEQASSVATPADGRPAETKEARSVVALSRVLCGEQSVLVSPPAAGQISWRGFGFSLQAAGGPLVPLPTDRHTATGTCEIGHYGNK